MKRLALAALVAALATRAAAAESPRSGSFDLQLGQYRPNIDAEPRLTSPPWQDAFGNGRGYMFRASVSHAIFQAFGALEVGFQSGYFQRSGFGQLVTGGQSGDETVFHLIPTNVILTYRFDWLADNVGVPLAPYARVAFERYNWWITDGAGKNSQYGATNGYSGALGLALQLDFFDPTLARELDQDTGINHSYVFAEARKMKVNDFGSSKSWDLSAPGISWSFGLLFVF